jgi:hypothetical protein
MIPVTMNACANSATPNIPMGDQEICPIGYDNGWYNQYYRFDLSSIPKGSTISSAMLGVYPINGCVVGHKYNIYQITESWDASMNWLNKPTTGPLITQYTCISNAFTPIVTQYIQAQLSNGSVDFCIQGVDINSGSDKFWTINHNGASPILVVFTKNSDQ